MVSTIAPSWREESLVRDGNGLHTGVDLHYREQLTDVHLGSFDRDSELPGDGFVGVARGDQAQYLAISARQARFG
jgi:hypothetical protein